VVDHRRLGVIAVATMCVWGHSLAKAAVPEPDAVAATEAPTRSDSLELYEEILSRGAAADEADAAAIAGEVVAAQPAYERRTSWIGGYHLDFETVTGYRTSERINAGWRGGSSRPAIGCSARRDGKRFGGFVELQHAGPLVRLVAGGIRPRFGEGLVLGTSYLPFASPRSVNKVAGAVPTSSIWGRKTGAAATVGFGNQKATMAAWRDPDGTIALWTWWLRRTAAGVFGVASGTRQPIGGADASFFAERDVGGVTMAGEVSVNRRRVFAVVHAVVEAGGRWNVTFFEAPSPRGFSAGVAAPGDELRRQSGAALHRTSAWNGIATRLTLYGSTRWIGGSVLRRRRLDASFRGRGGPAARGSWSVAVRLSQESELDLPDEAIAPRPETGSRRAGQFRCSWTGASASVFRQRYRLSMHVDDHNKATVVGTMGWILAVRGCEASCQFSNYEVSSGHTGYIVQPGVAGPEAVSAVSRSGTDVSARVRLHLGSLRVGLYWDRRWGKPARWYVSAGARL
jgi:hypothetical protein